MKAKKWIINDVKAFRSSGSINLQNRSNKSNIYGFPGIDYTTKSKIKPEIKYNFTNLSPDNALPVEMMNLVEWIDNDNLKRDLYKFKIDFHKMENKYGIEYTKNLIYSIMHDELGLLWFKNYNVDKDANTYLYNN